MVEVGEDSARGGFVLGFQPLGSREAADSVPVPLTEERETGYRSPPVGCWQRHSRNESASDSLSFLAMFLWT
jgi:hypothetical protein